MSKVRGIRGATTADSNEKDEVFNATSEMLAELVRANDLDADDVAAAFLHYDAGPERGLSGCGGAADGMDACGAAGRGGD